MGKSCERRMARPKDIQLRHHDAVRSKQRKVGRTRKLGRRSLLDKRLRDNGVRDLGLYEMRDYPADAYQLGYMT